MVATGTMSRVATGTRDHTIEDITIIITIPLGGMEITEGTVADIDKECRMKTKVLVVLSFVALFGCAMTPQGQRTVSGAAIGAGAGALIGAATGDPGRGAAIGAAVGGAAGALSDPYYGRGRRGRSPDPYYGSQGYYDRRDQLDCDDLENEKDKAACRRGKEKGATARATKVKRECAKTGFDYGYSGRGYPEDLPGNYEEEYAQPCRDGLVEGYERGEEKRARYIEKRAQRYEAGR